MAKIRVLLIAELADSDMVSVPLVAWSHALSLRKIADVHIVTQIRHRNSFLKNGLVEGIDFTAIDSEAVARPLHKLTKFIGGGWTTGMAIGVPAYYYFEHLFWKLFKNRLMQGKFDLVHRLTPLSPTKPSIIAKKCKKLNIPFIWGPIAGGLPWPKGFDKERHKEKEWLSYIRDAYKLLPGYRASREKASALVIASQDTWKQMDAKYYHKCIYLPENAIDPSRFSKKSERKITTPVRLVFIGRLVPYKCPDILIRSTAKLIRQKKVTLDIIGDGPEFEYLKSIVLQENIEYGITFHGNIQHVEVQDILVECDILAFPSIREFGGGVVLEAMALGLVPIVVNYGGPPELITTDTGIKVELGTREEITQRFEQAISELIENPDKIKLMGNNALHRIEDKFTWDAKASMMLQVYEWVLGQRPEKPNFGMPLD